MIEELGKLVERFANEPSVQVITLVQGAKALFDGVFKIRDEFFLNKLESFFIELKYGIITEEGLKNFNTMLEKGNKTPEDIYNLTVIVIDRLDRFHKAKYAAMLFNGFLNGKLRYEQYDDMLKIIEDWFESDTDTLHVYKDIKNMDVSELINVEIDFARRNRLVSMGVISKRPMRLGYVAVSERSDDYELTVYGQILIQLFTRHIKTSIDDFSNAIIIYGDSISNIGISNEEELKKDFPYAKLGDNVYVKSTDSKWYWNPYASTPKWVNSNIEMKDFNNLSDEEKKYVPYLIIPNNEEKST